MAFDPAIPLATDSPAVFPVQSQGNFTQLQKIVEQDHQFNLVAATNDGWHNLVHLQQQAAVTTPVATVGFLYSRVINGRAELFFADDTPVTPKNYQITPTMPIRAAVNFTCPFPAVNGAQTINSQYNVASVLRLAAVTGQFQINFTTALPDANYIVQITGMKRSNTLTNGGIIGCVNPDTAYPSANMTATQLVIYFESAGSNADPLMGSVTIFSVS